MRLAALAVAVAVGVTSLSLTAEQPPNLLDQDAYAVYGSALVNLRRELPEIALLAETRSNECRFTPRGWEDVAAAHQQANAQRETLLGGFDFGLPYQLVSGDELATVSKASQDYIEQRLGDHDPPIPSAFAVYPGGKVFVVSAVGFSADHTRAMFMLQHTCGSGCWGGDQILRVKVGGQWVDPVDVRERCSWVT